MRRRTVLGTVSCLLFLDTPLAAAAPDRDSLLEAWEAHIANLPGTM